MLSFKESTKQDLTRQGIAIVLFFAVTLRVAEGCASDEPLSTPTRIETPSGTVTVNPKPGESIGSVLNAALNSYAKTQVPKWIEDLGSSEFRLRQRATDSLKDVGRFATPHLVEAGKSTETEVALRAVTILIQLYQSDDPETSDGAHSALRQLATVENPSVTTRVVEALRRIEPRNLRQLGADVQESKKGAYVRIDRNWKGGDDGLMYLKDLSEIYHLTINSRNVTDGSLVQLCGLTNLKRLSLPSKSFTSDCLTHLSEFPQLETLVLPPASTDMILKDVVRLLPNLKALTFRNAHQFHGDGLTHLAGHGLRRLSLYHTRTNPDNLVHLLKLPMLESLQTPQATMCNEGMPHIGKLIHLTHLTVSNTRVMDAGLVHLRDLKSLESLNLDENAISDAGLANIYGLRNLKTLYLGGSTFVSEAGVKSLRGAIPGLDIRAKGLLSEPPPTRHMDAVTEIQRMGGRVMRRWALDPQRDGEYASMRVYIGDEWSGGDEGLALLADLTSLDQIDIRAPITDAAIPHLEKLAELKRIRLTNTLLSEEGKERLRAAHPKSNLRFSQRR